MPKRLYPVGFAVMIVSAGFYSVHESRYSTVTSGALGELGNGLSIANNTISVNSSTMLTSIPTLIIRN